MTWSNTSTTRLGSCRGMPMRSNASMASGAVTSGANAQSTGAMTVSPAATWRPTRVEMISSTSVPTSGSHRGAQQSVNLVVVQRSVAGTALDLGGDPAQPDVVPGDSQVGRALAQRVPTHQLVTDHDASLDAESLGRERFVAPRVAEHRLGVHPRLVVKGEGGGDRRREGDVDAEHGRHHRLELGETVEAVVLDKLGLDGEHPRDQTGERHDAVALTDAEDGGVDMGRTGLQRRQGGGHGPAGVVVGV